MRKPKPKKEDIKVDLKENSLNQERRKHLGAQIEMSQLPKPDLARKGKGTIFRFFKPVVSGVMEGSDSKRP